MTHLLLLTTFLLTTNLLPNEVNEDNILGVWVNEQETTHMEIYKLDGKYYGKIVWLPMKEDPNGNPLTDRNNPDEELRSRELWGLDVMEGFEFNKGKWTGGTFYSPNNGQKVSPTLELDGDDTLNIKVKKGLFRKTISWTRL